MGMRTGSYIVQRVVYLAVVARLQSDGSNRVGLEGER